MSYPRNAASPPIVAVGAIYLLADGTIQTTGASVRVKTGTGAWGSGAGTLACDSTSGIWTYAPTQAETDAESFVVGVYKSASTSAQVTVATSASATAGYSGIDWSKITAATTTVNLSGTTISTTQQVASVSGSVGSVTGAVGSVTGAVGSVTARVTANTDQWGGVTVTGMPMPTYTQPTGFLTATFPATVSSYAGGAVASVTGSVGSISGVTFPANFGVLGINASGHLSRVVLVDTTTTNTDMRGTDGAALASAWTATRAGYLDASITSRLAATSYTAPDNATISSISSNLVIINDNVLSRLSALAYTAPPSAATNATAVRTELGVELARIDAAITSRLAATSYTAPDNASIGSIKSVTDKLNTTLTADGLLWQFTINALENAPGGGGGGSATLENQELILANLDNVTGAVAAAVARLQLETQITGFPATLCRGSDYDTIIESEIRLQLLDLDNEPITEIGGTPVDEITWLFGFGTDRQPRLVEGACSWDDVTNELVIELSADDTEDTPLGAATWQIGAQIGELIRWLGGGTTRVIERQFTA